jgi:predicted nucleic acid-binding protein
VALMSDVMLDGTTTMSPMALYEVYKQTGNRYFKSIPDEGLDGGQRRVPIQANNVPFSGKLEELRNLYNAGLMTITNLISNQLDSGQITNQAVSQEVVKDAKSIGESTSNYIYDSFLNIMRRTAKVVQLRGWDILMYGKKFGIVSYDGYRQALGADKLKYIKLQATDDWSKTAFDVQIKTVIGDADQNFLEQNIQQCLAQQTITIADAMDIRELAISNVRWAAYILSKRIDERAQKKQADAMALSQQNTQAAVQGAQAKSQGEMQLEQIQAVNKEASDLRNRETQLLIEQEKFSGILKANIVTAVLARPGATMADLPSFVFEGVPLQKAVDHANDMNYLQTMAQAAQAMQAQQVGAPQQQQDPNAQQPQADQSTQGLQNAPQEQQEPQQNAAA